MTDDGDAHSPTTHREWRRGSAKNSEKRAQVHRRQARASSGNIVPMQSRISSGKWSASDGAAGACPLSVGDTTVRGAVRRRCRARDSTHDTVLASLTVWPPSSSTKVGTKADALSTTTSTALASGRPSAACARAHV